MEYNEKNQIMSEERYKSELGRFFSILIKTDTLNIRPLKSVREFYEEEMAMRHCVYSCRYFAKENSLILSARDNEGNRVETIEYDLKGLKVMQSRGVNNTFTPFHDEIVSVVEKNLPKMLESLKPRTEKSVWERAEGFSTTFMLDFKIANAFGESAIKDTFKRAFAEWKNDVLYLTSLCEVLNYWCWEYYERNNSRLSELYTELYEKASDYGYSTFTGEDARYFFQKLD